MLATLRLPRAASYADYLAVEALSEHRHELIDGVIVAMAGGSDEHNAIAGRLAMLLGTRLTPPCRYFTPDQRFWIAANGRGRYADGSVICGKPEHPPHDGQASTNPVLVVEVLSPTSEGDDAGDKRVDFQSMPSLSAYVVASQDRRWVAVYVRQRDGGWPAEPAIHTGGSEIDLPSVDGPIRVDEIYEGILAPDGRSLLK